MQARLFDQRELKAERVLAEALMGDLIVVFKRMRKQKKSVFDCFAAIGDKFRNRVQLMLEERHREFAQGKIHGRKMIGMGKDERPTGELAELRCDCDDLTNWAGCETDQEHAMSESLLVRHLLGAWNRAGAFTKELEVAMRGDIV